jgi:CRISPR-associated protein Cas5d
MAQGVKLHVWGDRACFTRPEMKVERVSYDVITPSAARGVLEAIHWKPAFVWRIKRLRVLKPIRFETLRRNEVASRIPSLNVKKAMNAGSTEGLALYVDEDRQQRAATILKDVASIWIFSIAAPARGNASIARAWARGSSAPSLH